MLWITATLMLRPAILQAACAASRNMSGKGETWSEFSTSEFLIAGSLLFDSSEEAFLLCVSLYLNK